MKLTIPDNVGLLKLEKNKVTYECWKANKGIAAYHLRFEKTNAVDNAYETCHRGKLICSQNYNPEKLKNFKDFESEQKHENLVIAIYAKFYLFVHKQQ